jgi:hypothetical protein
MATLLTSEEMRRVYGPFFKRSGKVPLDKTRVPAALWPLLPYAEFWGVGDDWTREALVRDSSAEVRENLKAAIAAFDDALDQWLAGPDAHSTVPSREYIAFSAMRMAADFA